MNEIHTAMWAALGALIPIVGTVLTVANYFSSKFEALGDRIDKVSAELDKIASLENERREAQLTAQAEYRERIAYLINDNRNRADHHREALEKKLSDYQNQVDRQLEGFGRELKDFRSFLNKNSDYIIRKSQRAPEP